MVWPPRRRSDRRSTQRLRQGRAAFPTARRGRDLNELEIAERVLAGFEGKSAKTRKPERARPAAVGKKHRAQGKRQMPTMSLSDATLKAVQAHDEGATASEVLNYLSREFGMAVRPNQLGMALQRHRRAGRLDNRDQRWHLLRPYLAQWPDPAVSAARAGGRLFDTYRRVYRSAEMCCAAPPNNSRTG